MISEMGFRVNAFVFFFDEGPCLQGVRKVNLQDLAE